MSLTLSNRDLYPVLRDIQSRFGMLLEAKATLQRYYRQVRRKAFEPDFELVKWLRSEAGVYLDVGANRGQSIDAIRLFNPDAEIHAFEPNEYLATQLSRRTRNNSNVNVYYYGLADSEIEADLYIPFYRRFMYDGLASFDRDEAASWLNKQTVWKFQEDNLTIQKSICRLKSMDSMALAPVFLKIDVQGNERSVLEGGENTISVHKPLIVLENNPAAHAWLLERGWKAFAYLGGQLVRDGSGPDNTVYLSPENHLHTEIEQALAL